MKSLHLTPLGPNITEVRYGDKYVLFSYQTPVAYSDNSGSCFATKTKYSNTTSKHIKTWLSGRIAKLVDQSIIDNIVR